VCGQFRSFMPEVISPLRQAMTTADQSRSCTSRLRCSSSRRNSVIASPPYAASSSTRTTKRRLHRSQRWRSSTFIMRSNKERAAAVNASRATRISS
jgi:hypothetical protein